MFRLDGKVALVTGAASGIGAGVAEALAEAGADVAVAYHAAHGHDPAPVVEVVEGLGHRAAAIDVDVASTPSVDAMVARVRQELGGLDIVVANAAIAPKVDADALTDDDFAAVVNVNLHGVFRCFRAALPGMRAAGWGRLLATSSTAGATLGWQQHAHYTAAKCGLIGLVRTLAVELGPYGVTVNGVAPGLVPTPTSLDPAVSLGPEAVYDFPRHVPVRRNGAPRDIGAAFAFLASEEASFVNGQVLVVDGGMSINPPA